MATSIASLRALSALLVTSFALTGCIAASEEEALEAIEAENDEITEEADLDSATVGETSQAATACTKSATFTFATSGTTTTASISGTPVAWFTKGAYTVRMTGPSRSLQANVTNVPAVTTTNWVRTLSTPFDPAASKTTLSAWLNAARAVNCATSGSPDVLSIAYDYIENTTKSASYSLGADFHDYLGTSWDPPDANVITADSSQAGSLDCSGYVRLVWGSRTNFTYNNVASKIPLSLAALTGSLPRASKDQYQYGPGQIVIPFRTQTTGATKFMGWPSSSELSKLQAGDLVFFDTACDYNATAPACGTDWNAISHVGIYIGVDTSGNYRFVSSRSAADGPTVANTGGWSVFNNATGISGSYHKRFRAARRL